MKGMATETPFSSLQVITAVKTSLIASSTEDTLRFVTWFATKSISKANRGFNTIGLVLLRDLRLKTDLAFVDTARK